jgi:hypothetical protein
MVASLLEKQAFGTLRSTSLLVLNNIDTSNCLQQYSVFLIVSLSYFQVSNNEDCKLSKQLISSGK